MKDTTLNDDGHLGRGLERTLEKLLEKRLAEGLPKEKIEEARLEDAKMLVDQFVESAEADYVGTYSDHTKEVAETFDQFEQELLDHWKEPLELLMFLIELADNLIIDVLEANQEAHEAGNVSAKIEALILIGTRCCRVSRGIVASLKAGYPETAFSSWRTLHELATFAMVLSRGDDALAERYIAHRAITKAKETRAYFEAFRDGECAVTEEQVVDLEAEADRVKETHGHEMRHSLGWASPAIGNKRPQFNDLEDYAGTQPARWRYVMACRDVHGGFAEPWEALSLHGSKQRVLLAGPSMTGTHLPGVMTSDTLWIAIWALFQAAPTLDRRAHLHLMKRFVARVGQAFHQQARSARESNAE